MGKAGLWGLVLIAFSFKANGQKENKTLPLRGSSGLTRWEAGITGSYPAHNDMFFTHGMALGANGKYTKYITKRHSLGIRAEGEHRFGTPYSPLVHPEKNFDSLDFKGFTYFTLEANFQYDIGKVWFAGLEAGKLFAILDGYPGVGMGFVEEFDRKDQFTSTWGFYTGRYFRLPNTDKDFALMVFYGNIISNSHGEGYAGLRVNYIIKNKPKEKKEIISN